MKKKKNKKNNYLVHWVERVDKLSNTWYITNAVAFPTVSLREILNTIFQTKSNGYIIQSFHFLVFHYHFVPSMDTRQHSFTGNPKKKNPPSPPISPNWSDNIDIPLNQNLLFLTQILNNILRHSQRISSNIDRRKRQPLRKTNINYPITLVKLQPMQVFRLGCVFDIVPGIVGEDGGVARGKIKRARVS